MSRCFGVDIATIFRVFGLCVKPFGFSDQGSSRFTSKSVNALMKPMYAIAFDLDTKKMEKLFGPSYTNKYKDIEKYLKELHFHRRQHSLYYGDKESVTMVLAVVAATRLSRKFEWFKGCVGDIRILQILDSDDLKPALE